MLLIYVSCLQHASLHGPRAKETGWRSTSNNLSSKTKGPGVIQKFRLRKRRISSADFPMTPGAISGGPFFSRPLCFTADSLRKKIPRKNPNPKSKSLSEQVFLNNFCWVPHLGHREDGKKSAQIFPKSSCKRSVVCISGFVFGFGASKQECTILAKSLHA